MRKVINISLPGKMEEEVINEVKKGNYASKSEFFRALLRDWQEGNLLADINKSRAEIKTGEGKVLNSLKDLK